MSLYDLIIFLFCLLDWERLSLTIYDKIPSNASKIDALLLLGLTDGGCQVETKQ